MAFDVISVIKQDFTLLFSDYFVLALAIIYTALSFFLGLLVDSFNFSPSIISKVSFTFTEITELIVYLVIFFLLTGFITSIAFIRIYKKKTDVISTVKKAAKRFPYFIVTSLLVGAIVSLGLIAFVIPGIYLSFKLLLAPVSSVTENKSPIEAIKRSWGISNGNWWYLFLLFFILSLILLVMSLIPYISYFFDFIIIIAYPLSLMAIKKQNSKIRGSTLA